MTECEREAVMEKCEKKDKRGKRVGKRRLNERQRR